jgi:uncharacterized OB-fold protein
MMLADRELPAPIVNPETRPYWDAAGRGKLLLKKCGHCGRLHHYPRALCPYCFADAEEWQEAAGTGTVYSFSIMRRAEVPYAVAYIRLSEGVTIFSNIVDCEAERIAIGAALRVVFKHGIPMFTLA